MSGHGAGSRTGPSGSGDRADDRPGLAVADWGRQPGRAPLSGDVDPASPSAGAAGARCGARWFRRRERRILLPRAAPGLRRLGVAGLAWSDVLEHFRAIENDLDFGGPLHGDNGPIRVRRTVEVSSGTEDFVRRAREVGYRWIADLNGESGAQEGVGAVPLNIVDDVRTGPGVGYLQPALNRPNLTVLTGTTARRIRINTGRAEGVAAVGADGALELTADRTVLCAGTIGSAHLLMVSRYRRRSDAAKRRRRGQGRVAGGMHCADHPEWVMPTDWTTAASRPVLEVVLSTADGVEIRPYTGGFVAMMGDHAPGHPDWPHVGVALMQPRARGRIMLVLGGPSGGTPHRTPLRQ